MISDHRQHAIVEYNHDSDCDSRAVGCTRDSRLPPKSFHSVPGDEEDTMPPTHVFLVLKGRAMNGDVQLPTLCERVVQILEYTVALLLRPVL